MEETLAKLKLRFPTLPQNVLKKIYNGRLERMRALKHVGLPADMRWIIEAKVRLAGEFQDSFVKHLPGMGRSSYAKKRRAKRMRVCHKCARWTCDTKCRGRGMVSVNREDKIQFIKDGLSKEPLDNIIQALETHPCGQVQGIILDLANLFHREKERYDLGDLTLKDPVCQFKRRVDEMQISSSKRGVSAILEVNKTKV